MAYVSLAAMQAHPTLASAAEQQQQSSSFACTKQLQLMYSVSDASARRQTAPD